MNNKVTAKIVQIENDFNVAINLAEKIYKNDGVFIYPTDTIYGFGGNPFSKDAIKKINDIKGRDDNHKYIFLIHSLDLLKNYIQINNQGLWDFLEEIWPAPVSIVLPLNEIIKQNLGYSTAAFRIPENKFCSVLLARIDSPLISTSVNESGKIPLNDVKMIIREFGSQVDAIFSSKKDQQKKVSTLIDLTGNIPKLIREGSVKFELILQKFYS